MDPPSIVLLAPLGLSGVLTNVELIANTTCSFDNILWIDSTMLILHWYSCEEHCECNKNLGSAWKFGSLGSACTENNTGSTAAHILAICTICGGTNGSKSSLQCPKNGL